MTFTISLAHFFADFFNAFFKPLGPYFIERFNIDSRTFTTLITLIGAFSSILQIFFGLYFDQKRRDGVYVIILLFLEIFLIALVGFANSFYVLLTLIFFIRLFNSAFHPVGASFAGRLNKGTHIAWFSVFGTFGAALGPIFITTYVKLFGIENLYIVGIISSLLLIFFYKKLWTYEKIEISEKKIPSLKESLILLPVFLMVALRGFIMNAFHTFVPIYLSQKGSNLIIGGATLTIGMIIGMFTNYYGTYLRDKIGIKFINFVGFFGMGISGILMIYMNTELLRIIAFTAFDAFGFLTMSANTVEAQFLMPKNKSFASSVSMGFAWAIGNFISSGYSAIFGNNVGFVLFSISIFSAFLGILYPILYKNKKNMV
ncbi:MFS transporter, FSR family, fosmidomycin resistance protein [Marinitoga hydrogenitolerans DSM 16785]|uniref:MFS transporter, FSR family, fosmidomycin resistance protein n=1 Tax=Marinitoga hydrogenitolerans (strain DSM 16785 / JCM 12826 / AT1271) TaxID=1122195 RepID=A0A1M4SP84_MARH1|nr:MFS transporter [Marinitoga hydrogenitolerans]SHE34011.1 MFS transporter, FSR family, fosmidomycin resistance protein [Marinitoga hydrogenitolerans DSM 16785]